MNVSVATPASISTHRSETSVVMVGRPTVGGSVHAVTSPAVLPPWPRVQPSFGAVVLREFTHDDLPMVLDSARDPYIPLIGTLPAHATDAQARDWIERQQRRWTEGAGFSFAIAEAQTGRAVGGIGLWLREVTHGRASAGYSIAPRARGLGYAAEALVALTAFGWSLPGLHRVGLYIEPWNTGSIRTAERAGYQREGLLRSHQEIGGRRRDMLLYAALRPG
jgi:ribosomal-protein-alanine N-acetyltransferase